ncbi:MAG: nucleotide exchange factor GrpE [Chitinispirillales bacterium]|jgi:molecular chaperone GrpE|nr:nucleotide exchange factor GrpE [Chitinispirillales bacterium]
MSGSKRKKTESMKVTPEAPKVSGPVEYAEQSEPDVEAVDARTGSASVDNGGATDEVAALRREVEAGKDRYLRLMAEFDNYKRRSSREYERVVSAANEKLILEMVDVRENFERALKSGDTGGEFASFYEGMKLIFAKYDEVLTRNGLTPFAVTGEPFDPMIHDALMKVQNAQIPVDCVAEVFERGYKLKDKVIKHARVVVSSGSGG